MPQSADRPTSSAPGSESEQTGGLFAISSWFIHNPIAANLLMLFFLVSGFLTISNIPTRVFPDVDPDVVTVILPFPGTTPVEVEESMTRRVEEAVSGIDGVRSVVSSARENQGVVTIEISETANVWDVRDDAKAAVDQLSNFPPIGAESPIIVAPDFRSDVLTLAVVGDVGALALRRAADDIERALLSLPDITLVEVHGARSYEISIEVTEPMLRRYGLRFADIADAVRRASLNLAGGSIRTEAGQILLRTSQKRQSGKEFESIVIRAMPDGSVIRLGSIATIRDEFSPDQVVTTYNGRPAVLVQIYRAKSQDVLTIKKAIDAFRLGHTPPEGIEIAEFNDQTLILRERINLLLRNCLFSFVLVFIFLILALDLKLAIWVSVGIFTAFLGGFLLFGAIGGSITLVSSFAFVMVLGLVVDDAIVIGESIAASHEAGLKGTSAAMAGVKNIVTPVSVGVITTIIAFAPLLVTTGRISDLARAIPMVIISVLIVSMIEAFLILPSHLKSSRQWSRGPIAMAHRPVERLLREGIQTHLRRALSVTLRWRYVTVAAAAAFFILCVGLMREGVVRFIFFPQLERNDITATVILPEGAPFSRTVDAVRRMEEGILAVAEAVEASTGQILIVSIITNAGGIAERAEHEGEVFVELTPYGERYITADDIGRLWRQEVGVIEGAERLAFNDGSDFFGADVGFELTHVEDARVYEVGEAFRQELGALNGVNDIRDDFSAGKRQFVFSLTPAGRAAGLSEADLARQIRSAFFGEEVQRVQRGRDEIRVYVRYPRVARDNFAALDSFRLRLPAGGSAPLFTMARISQSRAPAAINRSHGGRILTIEADVDEEITTPNDVNDMIVSDILPRLALRYPGFSWRQTGAIRDQNRDLNSIFRNAFLSLLAIFALIASLFRSYVLPIAIVVAVPLAIAGAIFGHFLLGYSLGITSLFGMVALSGVAVNASVVLIDCYSKLRREGLTAYDAALTAAVRRCRPIVLTTLTTALGLAPLLLESSPQAQFLIPMAVSLGAGIVISGIMVIFVTPAIAVIIDDISGFIAGLGRKKLFAKELL